MYISDSVISDKYYFDRYLICIFLNIYLYIILPDRVLFL